MLEIYLSLIILTFGILTAAISKKRNRNPVLWFFIGASFNMIGFCALLILSHSKSEDLFSKYVAENDNIQIQYSNRCSHCGSYVRMELAECPECQNILTTKQDCLVENPKKVKEFSDDDSDMDFLTCPNCRVINPIGNEKCQTCNSQLLTGKDVHQFDAA